MFEGQIYIVWRSSKGSKDIYAVFNSREAAEYNARIWQEEAKDLEYKVNFRVKAETIYGEEFPIKCLA